MKKLYLVILTTFLGFNLEALAKNTRKNQNTNPEFIRKDISKKRKELKRYKKDLQKMKRSNAQRKTIELQEKKVKDLQKNLQSEERTSTSFFLQTSDMTETRSTLDTNHSQDIHHAKYFDYPLDAVTDIHDKNSAYFRNH